MTYTSSVLLCFLAILACASVNSRRVADVDDPNSLRLLANEGDVDGVLTLLKNKQKVINPDHTDNVGTTALMLAARRSHIAVVEALLNHGANANLQDRHGNTALLHACEMPANAPKTTNFLKNRQTIIMELLKAGAEITPKITSKGLCAQELKNGKYEDTEFLKQMREQVRLTKEYRTQQRQRQQDRSREL